MLLKTLSRVLHTLFGVAGFVMQIIGIYFAVTQASQTPVGPFGLSILIWGVILFTIVSISVIFQLWRCINAIEQSYKFALSLDVLNCGMKKGGIDFELVLSNTLLDKPLSYKVALSKSYVEINGNKQTQSDKGIKGAVIPPGKSSTFRLGIFNTHSNYPYKGLLHYEIAYGPPDELLFHRITELNLYIAGPTYKQLTWTIEKREDKPFKKSGFYNDN